MRKKLLSFIEQSDQFKNSYQPTIYRLTNPSDKLKFEQLLNSNPNIFVFDEILGQVEELIKSQNPKTIYKKQDLSEAAKNHLGNNAWEEYGVWVFYPWLNKLVHILDEKEFIEVRTNRNQYKISPHEKEILSKKKVGVIGLSIGQSIAMTMAMERIFGEIRLADFDILELSNYNRIRSGLFNLGISKVIAVAREMAEIDPYLKVVCYVEGLNEDNMDSFFLDGGKLDLVVEACDGLDIKISSRKKAKELHVPVIMDTSDRGMLDVERFDLEPDRPILHGLIDHLDVSQVKFLKTNEEKVPFLLPIVGLETISTRSKASMVEVGQTITTWPQLASSVTLGGGLTTDVSRRILLNEFHDSGRYYVDVEEIVGNKNTAVIPPPEFKLNPSISDKEMLSLIEEFSTSSIEGEVELNDEVVKDLVNAATQAPSGANSQSWKFMYHNKTLYLFLDILYTAGLLDYENTTSYIGIGTATENLILKAHSLNLEVLVNNPDLHPESKLIVSFKFFNKNITGLKFESHAFDQLVEVIPHRLTNRNIGKREKIDAKILEELTLAARTIPGADLIIIDNEQKMAEVGEIIAKTDRIRVMDPGGHKDFLAEIRWTTEESEYWKNGIDLLGTVDLTPSELAGFRMAKHWPVIQYLNKLKGGKAFEKLGRKGITAASAVGLITMPNFSSYDFYLGGRAVERVWLLANKYQISFHPVSISTLIFNRMLHGGEDIIPKETLSELQGIRKDFERVFNIDKNSGEIMLFRIFKAGAPKKRSLRYPIETVLSISK